MTPDQQRSELLKNFDRAEQALRANLRRQDFQSQARAHTERALCHTQEAYFATFEIGKSRTVAQLVADLDKLERLFESAQSQSRRKVFWKHD